MIKCFIKLAIIYGIQQVLTHTVSEEKRVHAFRHKLRKQIRGLQLRLRSDEPQEFMDNYDLIVGDPTEMQVRTPHHHRRGHQHHHDRKQPAGARTNMKSRKSRNLPFLRRFNYFHDAERKKPQKWVHCLDLITPRLEGMKDDSRILQMTSNSADVKRLAELLYTDVSQFNAQDMVSLLSQISKIRIRMYQWDQTAMILLLNVIIRGSDHSFKTLKHGVKELISKWHLDISMMRVFLEQTRIFRPPCIDITGNNGFTKRPGDVIPYPKPDKPTRKPRDPNVSCKSKEKHEPYDNENP
ncbi:hypothetical protein PYW08_012214 [Mythimna loreyi]|uniref:Uncharacterized protein n=1 Tax=Mythimna loreyi TaxID=667449 RepID=A0ACC2PZK8_9NEOP|nr:hypothetical protein PYW08_012214 [Mythimna loreyi]